MAPKRKSISKLEKGESSTPITEPISPSVPSPVNFSNVSKDWFENYTAYGRWIDIFKNRSLSYVDVLNYNFFLFEDLEIISSFIQSTPGLLLNPGFISYPTLVRIFYSNLSFIIENGNQILRSFMKGKEIKISKTLINDLLKFSHADDDKTPHILALQNAKDLFLLESYSNSSSVKQLTHNALNLSGKLLHYVLVRTVFSRNSSCELVTDAHLILMWKIASMKNVDFAAIIFSTMRFCVSHNRNCALPYANLLTLIFDHFGLLSDMEEVDHSGPMSLSKDSLPALGIFKVNGKYDLFSNLSCDEKDNLRKIHGKRLSRLEPHLKEHTTISYLQSLEVEVGEVKTSLLDLHDKVSVLTYMLDTFMKEMKGMVVEDVVVEETVQEGTAEPQEFEKPEEKHKEAEQEKEAEPEKGTEQEAVKAEKEVEAEKMPEKEKEKEEEEIVMVTPLQTISPTVTDTISSGRTSKRRKTRSRK